ncbi:hypothetical protein ERJ75_000781500 [Trypanosoma vivax]|nr:hypothetical protein ERJ75_000781500 [Trypanosoma vivax]
MARRDGRKNGTQQQGAAGAALMREKRDAARSERLPQRVRSDCLEETKGEASTQEVGRMCRCRSKKNTARARFQRHMLQTHPEKQLSRGGERDQEAPDRDSETEREEQRQTEFACQQCHRVLKNKTWFTKDKCEPTSDINSEDSHVEEQSVATACPICSKESRYRWLLCHVLAKHPCHDESSRPQPRAKLKRKETRSEAQSQGEASGPLESAGDGDWDAETPWKVPGGSPYGKGRRERLRVRQVRQHVRAVVLTCLARAHAPQKRYDSEAEDEGRHGSGDTPLATITPMPVLPNEVCAKTVPYNAPAGEARPTETVGQAQLAEGGVQGVCATPFGVPKLARTKEEARSGNPEGRGVGFQCSTGQLLE